jgi:hypothetical protein
LLDLPNPEHVESPLPISERQAQLFPCGDEESGVACGGHHIGRHQGHYIELATQPGLVDDGPIETPETREVACELLHRDP